MGSYGTGNGQFDTPSGMAVDTSGNVYVADTYNHRIQKFNSSGTYVTQWGTYGTNKGQFNWPYGVAVSSGYVYVADTYNDRIQRFDTSGNSGTIWGSSGTGNGQFSYPYGVAVNGSGSSIYVADTYNNRIQKLNSSGSWVATWSSVGSGNGQFYSPFGVGVDGSANVYVADTNNDRIQKFNSSGTWLATLGQSGTQNGRFLAPSGVAVDGSGNIYVADSFNDRIQKFNSSLSYVTKWGTSGTANGQFYDPMGVGVDGAGNVYVADASNDALVNNDRIQKFDSTGAWLATWGSPGSGLGQFNYPSGVAVDGSGNVYVADSGNHRIQKRDGATGAWTKWGSHGAGDGYFDTPSGVAVDSLGNVYVADTGNNRIQKFSSGGVYLTQCGTQGAENGQFNYPYGVAVDTSGNVYVADTLNNRIQKVLLKYTVTVNASGTGSGTVTSSVGGINYTYPATYTGTSTPLNPGQSVTLTASGTGSMVTWDDCATNGGTVSGNGTGNATCTFTSLSGDKTVNVAFASTTMPPTVTTTAATGIKATGATLNGTVNPNGSNTTAYFQWGLTTSYGSTTPSQSMGSGTSAVPIPEGSISGLTCNTTYHYQALGYNSGGTSYGLDMTFTTSACTAPTVTTTAATGIAATGATLNGTVNPNGLSTTAYFQWGMTTSYGSTTASQSMGSGTSAVAIPGGNISGLTCNTTYHYQGVGNNSAGTNYGSDMTFTTSACPPTVQFAAASSSGGEATTPASIVVILSAASGQTVTVNYATSNGTATAGSDYTATSGTLTFNPGVTSQAINVPIINDTVVEGNETFTVTLTGPVNATLGAITTHTYTILDDDVASTIFISKDGLCSGHSPCFSNIQNGIDSASAPTAIKATQEIYNENIVLASAKVITLQGGWDLNFMSSSSATTIQGSITITNGTMKLENIILK